MKKLLTALVSLLPVLGMAQTITKISQFPNTNALGPNQLFVVTAGATNMNVKTSDMPGALGVPTLVQLTNTLSTKSNFIVSAHGNLFTTNAAGVGTNVATAMLVVRGRAGVGNSTAIFTSDDYSTGPGSPGLTISRSGTMGAWASGIGLFAVDSFSGFFEVASGGDNGAFAPYPAIAFTEQVGGAGGEGFRHYLTSRHSATDGTGNGLDFWLNIAAGNNTSSASSLGTGNRRVLTIDGTGTTTAGTANSGSLNITNNATVGGWLSQVGGTNYGDAAKTNWTTAITATGNDFLVTNTAGGGIRMVNGRLIVTANGTTTGGASNLVGGLTLGHTNDQRAYLTIGLTNGSGITNQYAILVTTNGADGGTPVFYVTTNGITYNRGILACGGSFSSGGYVQVPSTYGFYIGSFSASWPYLTRAGTASANGASFQIQSGAGPTASNNLFIAGQCIASNGIVAKIHSTYGPSTNIVPLTVIPNSGSGTNILEVQDTNGVQCFVVDSNNFVGIGTNLPAAPLHIVSTNVSGKLLCVQSNTTGTATLIVTNGRVGIGRNDPATALDVNGTLTVGGNIYSSGTGNIESSASGYLGFSTRSKFYSPQNSYMSIVAANGNDVTGLILGTNSIAAPGSGPTNAAPMLKKALALGASHTPGFKLTDNSDGTNGCFLEIKAMSQTKTNLTPDADSFIIMGVTNEMNVVEPTIVISNYGNFPIIHTGVGSKLAVGTNQPAAPLHIVSTNISGSMLVVQTNTTGTATLIVTNGRVGIGMNNPNVAYALDVSGYIHSSSAIVADARIQGQGVKLGSTAVTIACPTDSYVAFVDNAAKEFTGLIFGTNSIAAPASGPTNAAPMLKKARQFSTPATHVPGFKLTDQSDGTNGCFLELKSVSSANTNKLVPESASVIHFATTNGTPDGKAEGWIVEENGKMYRTRPCGFGALMNDTSNTVVCAGAAGVYTNMAGTAFTTIVTNDFTGGKQAISAGLTNVYAGYYRIFINASYLGGNSTTYEFDVTTNGVICDLIEVKNTTDNPARFRTSSAGGIIYLPANCGVQMMVQDGGSGSTINVFRSSLTIGTP